MGANGSSQQTFTALGPITVDNYKEFVPKKKIKAGVEQGDPDQSAAKSEQQKLNNGQKDQPTQAINQTQEKPLAQSKLIQNQSIQQQPSIDTSKALNQNQKNQHQPEAINKSENQPQISQPNKQTVIQGGGSQSTNNPQQQVKQMPNTNNSQQQINQAQVKDPAKVTTQEKPNNQMEKQKQQNMGGGQKETQQPENLKQPANKRQTVQEVSKQYRRRANWNIVQSWDKIGSYLHARDIIKLVALSKPVRKQIMQGVSYKVAQSKYLEGIEYIEVEEEEEGGEEEMEEYQDGTEDGTYSPNTLEQLRVEQSSSPSLKISTQDPIRNSAVNKPMTTSFHDKTKNDQPFKKAQTLNRLTSIQETLRETSEIDSLDKKDRAGCLNEGESIKIMIDDLSPNPNKELEEVMETESRSIYTETEGQSFENSLHREKNLKKQDSKKMNVGDYGQNENRSQQKHGRDDSTSNAASNLNYMMKTIPSNAENPMQSLKFNEELIYDKIHQKDRQLNHQGSNPARSTQVFQWDNNDAHLKPIDSKAHSSMHLSPGGLDEKDIFHQTGIKKQISEVQDTRQQQIKAFIPNIKHLNAPPKMHLKETLQYKAALPTPMIRIFEEEIDKQSLKNSIKEQNSGQSINSLSNITAPKAEQGDTSPKIGNQGSQQRNISQFPGGKNMNQIDAQVENEQTAKEMAYQQFKEIYEKRLQQQKEQSHEAQQKAKKAIDFQKPFTTSRNKKGGSQSTVMEHSQTVGNLPLISNGESSTDENRASLQEIMQSKLDQTPSKKNVHFEDQLKELKEDMQKY